MEAVLVVEAAQTFENMIGESCNCDFFETRSADDFKQIITLEELKCQIDVVIVFVDFFKTREKVALHSSEERDFVFYEFFLLRLQPFLGDYLH